MEVTVISTVISKLHTIILSIYRPPNSRLHWFETLNDLLHEVTVLGKIIIMGDLNCDLLKPSSWQSQHLNKILSIVNSNLLNYEPTPTRLSPTTATCLDIISIDRSFNIISYQVVNLAISDQLSSQSMCQNIRNNPTGTC